jgi:purine-binding chemotaxis protein CheW
VIESSFTALSPQDSALHNSYLTVKICDQLFGFPTKELRDIFKPVEITPVPLASNAILGSINLRGRIVTVIDLRLKLYPNVDINNRPAMHIAVINGAELLSFVVDSVGEVINIKETQFDPLPSTLESSWKNIADGVFQLDAELLIKINMTHLLNLISTDDYKSGDKHA